MESQSHSFIAGLFVILLALGGIAGALWLGPDKGPARLPIDLLTTYSVSGLKVDAPVRFRGVDVGRVDSISFDPRQAGEIRVRVSVDPAAPISKSTYAKLSYQGITGVAFVQLDDEKGKSSEPLPLSREKVAQMELQASVLERAETDIREVLLKAARVADRLDELLNEQNQKRVMALVDSFEQTSERYGELARNLEPSAKALPGLLQQATRTVEKAQRTVDNVAKLAEDTDRKLVVLDTVGETAKQIGRAADDLHKDTLPRVNALIDQVSIDARELKRTLHQVNARPQSLIFGLQPPPPGPGERGFVATKGGTK
ncbi:MAG TPA: MlaD family protein [Burkholderiales bacterium]|nr:MlaD family protein [Burkholderiales bacterium]